VRWKGVTYPDEGARGLHFPYTSLPSSGGVVARAETKVSQVAESLEPEWLYRDNGFQSRVEMERRHAPVIALARKLSNGIRGMILDLGCGNGLLVQRICAGRKDLIPCGSDNNRKAIEHARSMWPRAESDFSESDIYAENVWAGGKRYVLALLSINRLIEAGPQRARRLIDNIETYCSRFIVYRYPEATGDTLEDLAKRAGLTLGEVNSDGTVAVVRAGRTLEVDIDWSRMAKPQADGYDAGIALRLCEDAAWLKNAAAHSPVEAPGGATLFGSCVRVINRPTIGLVGSQYIPAPCDHPNLVKAEQYLNAWPEVAAQFPRLVTTIQPWIDTSRTPEEWQTVSGSSSNSFEDEFGTILLTVDNVLGTANATVHEMAHHKLRALGVSVLKARRLIVNDPSERYFSPIRDRKRPMTAVLHAQYSFIHVACLECALHDSVYLSGEERRQLRSRLAWHVDKMDRGYSQLERNVRTDAEGAMFMEGFMSWSRDVLSRSGEILREPDRKIAAGIL
jgi:hypothetical protein